MNNRVENYWLKHYVNDGHCSLCGNVGIVDTTDVKTPAGLTVGRKNYCICPNGQVARQAQVNVDRFTTYSGRD